MPVEPTTENLLTVASYGITGRIGQLIDAIRLLEELHGARCLDPDTEHGMDTRCKTCRTSSGKPAPWPCVTWLRFAEVFELDQALSPAVIALYHAIGKRLNGGAEPDWDALTAATAAERNNAGRVAIGAGERS